MKVIDPGHRYVAHVLDDQDDTCQHDIQFVKRIGVKFPGNNTHYCGTILQELWRIEIDRLKYVNKQAPCAETVACIELLRTCILLLEQRAARRHGRVLELTGIVEIESIAFCTICGHIQCGGHNENRS